MGWINCDRFYDDPSAGKADITITCTAATPLQFVDYSLVIPDMNVRLAAFKDELGNYSFTRKNSAYTKLPIGKPAIIVGVSLQHDSIYFGSQKIVIKDGLALNMPMQTMAINQLNAALQNALKQ